MRLHGHVPPPRRQTLGPISLSTSGLPVMEALMEALLQVVLLKEAMMLEEVLVALSSLSLFTSPSALTPTQTTMPQTRPGGA